MSGLGARWAAIGPFAAMDAAGLDVHAAVAAQLFPQLSAGGEVPALLQGQAPMTETMRPPRSAR